MPFPYLFLISFWIMLGHEMFSFIDGFSGYNQIRMAPEDEEKTVFYTPIGDYCYNVMPFSLKNAGTTYQRAMQFIFADMIHEELEDYVYDIIVKSKTHGDYLKIGRAHV